MNEDHRERLRRLRDWPGVDCSDPRVAPAVEGDTDGWDVIGDSGVVCIRDTGMSWSPWQITRGPAALRGRTFADAADAVAAALDLDRR